VAEKLASCRPLLRGNGGGTECPCNRSITWGKSERIGDPREPPLGHRVAQGGLARKMPVHAPVADVERSRDVDDRGLGGPEAAENVLGRLQDPLRREDGLGHPAAAPSSLSSEAICDAW